MVQSIHLQQGLLQANSVERIQQVQQQHPDVQQRHFELELNKEKKRTKEKVKDSEKTEKLLIKERDHRNNQEHAGRDKAEPGDTRTEDVDESVTIDQPGAKIDVRV